MPVGAARQLLMPVQPPVKHSAASKAIRVKDPIVQASPKVRKDKLNTILSRSEFAGADYSLSERFLKWFGRAIDKILGGIFGSGIGPIGVPNGFGVIVTVIAIVLLIGILALITSNVINIRRTAKVREKDEDNSIYSGPTIPRNALDEAQKMAVSGDYRAALRLVYLAILLRLDERDLIRFDRTGTNWEYLSMLRKYHQVHDTLKPVTMVFDRKWYGHESACDGDYQSFIRAYESVEAAEAK
ncbi:MAG: DUF4129 domain-containing protein [Armatimonadota bacterium]